MWFNRPRVPFDSDGDEETSGDEMPPSRPPTPRPTAPAAGAAAVSVVPPRRQRQEDEQGHDDAPAAQRQRLDLLAELQRSQAWERFIVSLGPQYGLLLPPAHASAAPNVEPAGLASSARSGLLRPSAPPTDEPASASSARTGLLQPSAAPTDEPAGTASSTRTTALTRRHLHRAASGVQEEAPRRRPARRGLFFF